MNLNGDRDRFLIALAAALVFHIGIAVGLTFVDWSSPPPSTTLTVDLGAPVETDVPEVDPEPIEQDEPEEPEPEDPDEPDEPEPPEPEPPEPEEFEPADSEAGPDPDESASQQASPPEESTSEPEPAEPSEPRRPQGPSEEEAARALDSLRGDDGDEARQRTERDPIQPEPGDNPEIARAREDARDEFEQALEEERRREAAAAESQDEQAEEGGDPDASVTAKVSDLLGQVRNPPTTPSSPDEPGDGDDTEGEDSGTNDAESDDGDDFVTWDGEGNRRLLRSRIPEMDGSDLRASGAPEVRARIQFEVDERGVVRPGSVNVDAPGLTSEGRGKIRQAMSEWRFERNPGSGIARGSVDFIFQRTGGR